MSREFGVPPPHVEALVYRLMLTADANNIHSYKQAIAETMCSYPVIWSVIDTLITSLKMQLDYTQPGWQEDTAEHLALLLDCLEWQRESSEQ